MELLLTIVIIVVVLAAIVWGSRLARAGLKLGAQREEPAPTLEDVLSEVPAGELAGEPHTFRRPHFLQTFVYVLVVGAVLVSFLVSLAGGGWTLLSLLLAVAEIMLLLVHGPTVLISIARSLTLSQEGIEVRELFRHRSVFWWEIQRFLAAEDLSRFRAEGMRGRLTYDTLAFPPETRLSLYRALRAYLASHQQEMQPWPQGAPLVRFAKANALSLALFVAAMIGTILAESEVLPEGNVLGLRCSYASSYLRARFDLPDRHGCVILRVNPGTGAYGAGLRQGDLIVALEDVPITSGPQFTLYWESLDKRKQKFTVVRSGSSKETAAYVTLGPAGRAPERDPNDPFYYYLRARGSDDIDRAIADYTKALDLAPEFDLAYAYRGALLVERYDYDPALADFNKALDLDPELSEAYRERAWLYIVQGEYEAAIADAARAAELDGCTGGFGTYNYDCHIDHVMLAYAYGGRGAAGDFLQATEDAKKGIYFYPDRPRSYYLAAYYLSASDALEEAEEYAARYLEAAEGYDEPDDLLGWARRLLSGSGLAAEEPPGEEVPPSSVFVESWEDGDIEPDGDPVVTYVAFSGEQTVQAPPVVRYLTPDRQQLWAYLEFDSAAYVEAIFWFWSQNSTVNMAGGAPWSGTNKGHVWILLENRYPNENSENVLEVRFDQAEVVETSLSLRGDPYIGAVTFYGDPEATQPLLVYGGNPNPVYAAFDYLAVPPGSGLLWSVEKDGADIASGLVELAESGRAIIPIPLPPDLPPGLLRLHLSLDGEPVRGGALAVASPSVASAPPFQSFQVGLEADSAGRLAPVTKEISANVPEFQFVIDGLSLAERSELSIRWTLDGRPLSPLPDTISGRDSFRQWIGLQPGEDSEDGYLDPGEYQVVISLDGAPVYADVVVVR